MNKKFTKIVAVVVGLTMAFTMVATVSAQSMNMSQLIDLLIATGVIAPEKAAAARAAVGGTTVTTTTSTGYTFTTEMGVGSRGAQVTALQQAIGVSPATGYFGAITKAAVVKFQADNGIKTTGYVGPMTMAALNRMGGSTTTTTVPGTTTTVPVTGVVTVALAPTTPGNGAIIAGQAAAALADFTFTNGSAAPVTVTNVTLSRGGVSSDNTLSNVYLYNGAVRLTDSATVSSGKITFNGSTLFTIPAASSIIVSVKADIAGSSVASAGQIVSVSLTGAAISGTAIAGNFPISGAAMTVASASDIATVTLAAVNNPVASGSTISIQAGSLNQTIWSSAMNISQRAVNLKAMALKVIGSVPANTLQNIKLYAGGIQIATAAGIDANGIVTFDMTAAPYKIDSSRTLEVRADIVNGSSRSFSVSLQNAADMQVVDSNYNVGLTAALQGTTAFSPISTGNIQVSNGSVSISLDNSLSSGDLVTGASNVPLARYTMKSYGEDMKISYMNVGSTDQLDNVALYANGVQIGSTQTISATTTVNPVGTPANLKLFNLGSSLIIPAGQTVVVEVRGDIKYNGTNATTTSNTVQVSLVGYTNNAQGSFSQQLTTIPATEQVGPLMTVKGAGLSLAKNPAVSDYNVSQNTAAQKLGSFIVQAGSAENIKVTNVTVTLGGAAGVYTNISNLYVRTSAGNTTPVNAQASNNFNLDLTVAANGSAVIDVFGDIGATTGTASTTLALSGYGVNSNTNIANSAVTGQSITVGSGTLGTPTKNSNSYTTSQLVLGGSTSPIMNLNFVSSYGASTISEMYFTVNGGITKVTVDGKDGNVVDGVATVTGLNKVIGVGSNGSVDVPVTVTYAAVGDSGVTSGLNASTTLTGYKYTSGNNTVSTTTLSVASNGMVLVGSKPTVELVAPTSNVLANGSQILGSIKITANNAGKIDLRNVAMRIATSGATVTDITVWDKRKNAAVAAADATTTINGISFINATNGLYKLAAGESVTFEISGTVSGLDNNTGGSVTLSAGTNTNFLWVDRAGTILGGSDVNMTGAYIVDYPTNSVNVVR
jgi:hypothetical protein